MDNKTADKLNLLLSDLQRSVHGIYSAVVTVAERDPESALSIEKEIRGRVFPFHEGIRDGINCRKSSSLISGVVVFLVAFLLAFDAWSFCFEEAGNEYGIAPILLYSIADVESGFNPSAINYNANGTYDYDLIQINSSQYKKLGHKVWNSLGDPCTNVKVGAWILSDCISKYGNTWEAVGCYNAVTPEKKTRYARKIQMKLTKLQRLAKLH